MSYGKITGNGCMYDYKGILKNEGYYSNGKLHGNDSIQYYENGEIHWNGLMNKGLFEGYGTEYVINGQI